MIRDIKTYTGNLWNWDFLNGCFSNGIRPTDLDGIVERNGKFLVLETKSPDVPIPIGQRIMFGNMAESGLFHVVVIWGKPNIPQKVLVIKKGAEKYHNPASLQTIKNLAKDWFLEVNNEESKNDTTRN